MFQFEKDNMLMQEESFYLNSMQSYVVAPKECLRKTMLHQDIIFRNQVQELHRLYSKQKILMEDIDLNQLDRCTQSTWLIENSEFSSTAMFGSTLAKSQVLPDRHNSVHNTIHMKSLGPQISSDQRASHVDQEALNLSLSVVKEDRRIKATASKCFDQKINSCTQNIIDLEVSTEGISNEEGNCAACTTTFATMTKCESQISVLKGMMENTSCCRFGNGQYSLGSQGCHKALVVNKSSLKECISLEAGKLDLNQVHLDDSSGHSSDNSVNRHSTASSLHIFGVSFDRTPETKHPSARCRKENSKSQYDASDIPQWDDAVNSVVMNSNIVSETSDLKYKGTRGCEAGLIGNESVARTWVGMCKDLSYCTSDPENKYSGSIWKHSGGQFTDPDGTYVVTKMVKNDNTKDDEISCARQSATEEKYEDGNILPALCEPSCVVDNSGIIKTSRPLVNLGYSNLIIPDQDLGSGDRNELGHGCPKKVELPEVSMCIQTAAQLLINFSSGNSSGYQDCSSKSEPIKVDKEMEKVECSDSFEQIALKLEECNVDEGSVSSKAYEIDTTAMGKKDFGFRLKRGRRFKDFQKEILPGLASLSRHEIQEDINILKAVLRSREYRKIRSWMGDQSSWCAPMRSRRSKRNYVQRKIF